jgi:hypothetical protein
VELHDGRAAGLVYALACPARADELAEPVRGLSVGEAALVVGLRLNAEMVGAANDAGESATDSAAALQSWEFQDLVFHARSRGGHHANPTGGTYRFAGRLPPAPALKPTLPGEAVDLHRPDLDRLRRDDPPFASVQGSRRSIREHAARPLSAR